jgi:hypothetical protein
MNRPTGVTILGVLAIVGGVFEILAALALFGVGLIGAAALGQTGLGALGLIFGLIFLVLGVLYVYAGVGMFRLWPLAWRLGLGLSAISITLQLIQWVLSGFDGTFGVIISIAISAYIIYYLQQPHVRAAFGMAEGTIMDATMGRTAVAAAPMAPPPAPAAPAAPAWTPPAEPAPMTPPAAETPAETMAEETPAEPMAEEAPAEPMAEESHEGHDHAEGEGHDEA